MKRGKTGTYNMSQTGGEQVYAFIPNGLPPDPPLEISHKRQQLFEQATLALGRLDSITLLLPDPNIFLYAYVRREAVLSSQIEGTQSSLSDLLLFELEEAPGVPRNEVSKSQIMLPRWTMESSGWQRDFHCQTDCCGKCMQNCFLADEAVRSHPGNFAIRRTGLVALAQVMRTLFRRHQTRSKTAWAHSSVFFTMSTCPILR